jgi:hypothetical protein
LGSQLSAKFYLCANAPTGTCRLTGYHVIKGKPCSQGPTARLIHNNYSSYSLDKRYHFKHVFALLCPEFECPSHSPQYKVEIPQGEGTFIDSCAIANHRRGPPAV